MENRVSQILAFITLIIVTGSCAYKRVPNNVRQELRSFNTKSEPNESILYKGMYVDIKDTSRIIYGCCGGKTYYVGHETDNHHLVLDLVFLRNGLCTMGYFSALRDDATGIDTVSVNLRSMEDGGLYWGVYKIEGGFVKVKLVARGSLLNGTVDAFEQWYKIINQHTLLPIYARPITKNYCTLMVCPASIEFDSTTVPKTRFKSADKVNIIDPDKSWLLHQKWFWTDKKQYRQWKRRKEKDG